MVRVTIPQYNLYKVRGTIKDYGKVACFVIAFNKNTAKQKFVSYYQTNGFTAKVSDVLPLNDVHEVTGDD